MSHVPVKVQSRAIFSGKFRRYHGLTWQQKLFDFPTIIHNFFDLFLIGLGFLQSLWLLAWLRPSVIFCKGGFVCLPVGYAAALLKIPLVIHDSDAHPGLTNRLLAPRAAAIATGAPVEYYPSYPASKTHYVGIPTFGGGGVLNAHEKRAIKKKFSVSENDKVVVITGGGLGAKRVNDAVIAIAPELLKKAHIIHLCGMNQYAELRAQLPEIKRYQLIDFIDNAETMRNLLAIADVVVSRAGATTMLELASVGAPTILVPNTQLVGDHQTKNAAVYAEKEAALIVKEDALSENPELLLEAINSVLSSSVISKKLSDNILELAKPDAAKDVVKLIEKAGNL